MSYIEEFSRQFRALAWKNSKLKLRGWVILLLEVLVPTILLLILGKIKANLRPTLNNAVTPSMLYAEGNVLPFSNLYDIANCGSANLVWRCTDSTGTQKCPKQKNLNGTQALQSKYCQQTYIAVAPLNTDGTGAFAASSFVAWANSVYAYGHGVQPSFRLFNSEQDIMDILQSQNYSYTGDIFSSAVIFNSGYPDWDYTLRLNKTYTASGGRSRKDVDSSSSPMANNIQSSQSGRAFFTSWVYDGYATLSNTVNTYIATATCRTASKCNPSDVYLYSLAQSNPFPSPAYNTTGFWGALGFVFALWMIIVLLYPLANVISVLVREKEAKLREGMKMMALRAEVLWASWWFNFMALFLPLSLILTWAGKQIFLYSSSGLIFLYFLVFFISATAYAIFMSSFFTNSRTAAIVGSLVFLAGFFIYIGMMTLNPSYETIMLANLHPATAFTFGTLAFIEYEDSNIGVTWYTYTDSNNYNVTFRDCLVMMIVDAIWLTVVTWYIDKIWPSEWGTHEPFYFLCTPSYWRKLFGLQSHFQPIASLPSDETHTVNVEEVSETLSSQIADHKCVEIRNLRKMFKTPQGIKMAVDGLNLTMYRGQITSLLGHNGAGKSTAIAMLTGLLPADGGTAIIDGKDMNEDMQEIRKNLGVCPQHDILFPDLTVQEHLAMFAMFKGVKSSELASSVASMINVVGLTEKADAPAKMLSGGQKRKLSVGIAFIGGSNIIFLDEPTSGMDPYSRRFTWNLIRQHREGRVIVLTTHFMDEADLLGDRIAIMGDGKLLCCGTSLYLKNMYGVGYNMTLEKKSSVDFNSFALTKVVHKHVPDATLLTDVGTEISYQLPFSKTAAFPALFENIETNLSTLGLESYGISVTTLEEVFIKITKNLNAQKGIGMDNKSTKKENILVVTEHAEQDFEKGVQLLEPILPDAKLEEKIPENHHFEYFFKHVRALFIKRALYFIRDVKAQMFTFVVPIFFLTIGLIIMSITYPATFQPLRNINASMYNTKVMTNVLPTPYVNPADYSYQVVQGIIFGGPGSVAPGGPTVVHRHGAGVMSAAQDVLNAMSSNFPLINTINGDGSPYTTTPLNMTDYLLNHKNDYEAMIVGTYTMLNTKTKQTVFSVSTNYTAVFALPVYQQVMVDATVRSLDSSASVSTNIYPFPETKRQMDRISNFNVDLVATFIMLAIPFVPAAFITYIVREKEVKAKHQQMVSGVGVVAYWISTLLWDNLNFFITTCLFAILVNTGMFSGDTSAFGASGNQRALECFFGLFILFGFAMAGFTYLLSYLFRYPSTAQVVMIFLSFITGLVLSIVGVVLRILPDYSPDFLQTYRYLFCIFPPYALGEGLHNMALLSVWSGLEQGGVLYDVKDWQITGIPMMMLAWEAVVYLGLTIIIEYVSAKPSFQQYIDSLHVRLPPNPDGLKDEDVLAEEKICGVTEARANAAILVTDIKKQYYGGIRSPGKYAVRGVSLGVPYGQCFGLLGINGAGKSSLLSMLSGEFAPSDGKAYLAGLDLLHDVHTCRRKIGYCPQFDSLFELLTGREHLELYSRIKGVKTENIKHVVDSKIAEMGLTEYADRRAGTYSGGNKRKLSVAMAMIGEPSIVFLDEPSTGMDPLARRSMWDLISDIVIKRRSCALILTTHSMEECEALCNRIGIMVSGVLRCLGSAQRLRSKYGTGYQIEIGTALPTVHEVESMTTRVLSALNITTDSKIVALEEQQAAGAAVQVGIVHEHMLTEADVQSVFGSKAAKAEWKLRLTKSGSGESVVSQLEQSKVISIKHFASWLVGEVQYDGIIEFCTKHFGQFMLRERQHNKIRIEISSTDLQGHHRSLSTLFSLLENNRLVLNIQDYAIAQTSLEQIFNFFAAQQEEETGEAVGLTASAGGQYSVTSSSHVELAKVLK